MTIDNWTIEVPCPQCQRKLPVTIGQLQQGNTPVCPTCQLTGAEARLVKLGERLERLGRSIHDLRRSLMTETHP